jgi:hypothetical protein
MNIIENYKKKLEETESGKWFELYGIKLKIRSLDNKNYRNFLIENNILTMEKAKGREELVYNAICDYIISDCKDIEFEGQIIKKENLKEILLKKENDKMIFEKLFDLIAEKSYELKLSKEKEFDDELKK